MSAPKCEIDSDGTKMWHVHGLLHREDGPAVYLMTGQQYWYINNVRMYSFVQFQRACDCNDDYIMFLQLKYGDITSSTERQGWW